MQMCLEYNTVQLKTNYKKKKKSTIIWSQVADIFLQKLYFIYCTCLTCVGVWRDNLRWYLRTLISSETYIDTLQITLPSYLPTHPTYHTCS